MSQDPTSTTVVVDPHQEHPAAATNNALVVASSAAGDKKCSIRGCKVKGAEATECQAKDCEKKCHVQCYHALVLAKNNLATLPNNKVACTKKCHAKVLKESAGSNGSTGGDDENGCKGNWDCDGLKGEDDPHTSVQILLDWWLEDGNYSRFCGKNNDGMKKIHFANKLAEKMTKETTSKRTGKNVLNKIQHIEAAFKKAYTFANTETGAGLKENDNGTFEEAVTKKCPYYFDLLDIMSDRASSKPQITSYDLMKEDDVDDVDDEAADEEPEEEDEQENTGDVSDISDDEKTATSKRTAATTAMSSNKKKKKSPPTGRRSPFMSDEAMKMLNDASAASKEKHKELVRHHAFLEKLEERKCKLAEAREHRESTSWKGKSEELDYKMKLLQKYQQLKDDFGWDDDQIVDFYPDMAQVVKAKKERD
jgi:hypothetical protein